MRVKFYYKILELVNHEALLIVGSLQVPHGAQVVRALEVALMPNIQRGQHATSSLHQVHQPGAVH